MSWETSPDKKSTPSLTPATRECSEAVRIMSGFRIPARFVVHTVGPVWRGGGAREKELLAGCYQSSLELAASHGAQSITFPCISTGAFGFPIPLACKIAVREVAAFLESNMSIERALLVAFNHDDADFLRRAVADQGQADAD